MSGRLVEVEQLLQTQDPEMAALLMGEGERQQRTLKLIPSENHASLAVRLALVSGIGDNYAEGYPGARYYQGQVLNDKIERLTRGRVGELFGAPHVNVQPYSGSPANLAVEKALLLNGDTIMGLALDAGGHLTHGAAVSLTGRDFRSVPYYLRANGYIDYDQLADQAKREMPKLIIAGTTAYPRHLRWDIFRQIADSVGAFLMADIAHAAGLVAGEAYPTPVPFADVITFTGHKTFRGPRSGVIMVTQNGLSRDPEMGKKIDRMVFPGLQGGPHMNTIAALGVAAQEASTLQFRRYASKVVENARVLAEILIQNGMDLVTGGTDSHLMLLDLRRNRILGNTAAEGLERAGLVANRNTIPHDSEHRPFYPGGLRIGTPAITSRGMGPDQMRLIGSWVSAIINGLSESGSKLGSDEDQTKRTTRDAIIQETDIIFSIREDVVRLCEQFPIPDTYV